MLCEMVYRMWKGRFRCPFCRSKERVIQNIFSCMTYYLSYSALEICRNSPKREIMMSLFVRIGMMILRRLNHPSALTLKDEVADEIAFGQEEHNVEVKCPCCYNNVYENTILYCGSVKFGYTDLDSDIEDCVTGNTHVPTKIHFRCLIKYIKEMNKKYFPIPCPICKMNYEFYHPMLLNNPIKLVLYILKHPKEKL